MRCEKSDNPGLGGGVAGLCEGGICQQLSCILTGGCTIFSCPCRFAQATCMCWPGLKSINNNASEGCQVSCKPQSCDKSATCQVTPDRKTRLAQGPRGMGTGQGGWSGQYTPLCASPQGLAGRTWGGVGPRGWSVLSLTSLSGSPAVCAKMTRWVTVTPAMDICCTRSRGPIRLALCSCG